MAKDPAFLFYPGDFMSGTLFMTDEQVGKYIRLLLAQHQHGHLSENQVNFICKTYDKDVMSKFRRDEAGLYYNERLEIEIVKRREFCQSRSKNREGKKSISNSYVTHMENRNKNENTDEIIEIGEPKKFSVAIKPKYVGQRPVRIYDLKEYFSQQMQLLELERANLNKFEEFMEKNPAAVFNDDRHLYNSFLAFHQNGYTKTNREPKKVKLI